MRLLHRYPRPNNKTHYASVVWQIDDFYVELWLYEETNYGILVGGARSKNRPQMTTSDRVRVWCARDGDELLDDAKVSSWDEGWDLISNRPNELLMEMKL